MARNIDEKKLTAGVFPDVGMTLHIVWVVYLLENLTALNFTLYIAKTISSSLHGRTFEASFPTATSICRSLQANVVQGEIISPVILSLYIMDMYLHFRHFELPDYAGNTTITITSGQPGLIINYLES